MNNMKISWSAASEIEEKLRLRYVASVCDLHLNYARRRNTPENLTKLQRWIHSTFQKDAFAWAMVYAKAVKLPASQSDITAMTKISRQSVSIMVLCDDEKIEPESVSNCKGTLKYQAGDELMQLANRFVERHIETTEDTYMNKNWDDLMAIRRVRSVVL